MKRTTCALALALSAVVVVGCSDEGRIIQPPELNNDQVVTTPLQDRYIVVLNDDVRDVRGVASRMALAGEGTLDQIYTTALKGFAVEMTREQALEMSLDSRVAYVEQDMMITLVAAQQAAAPGGKPGKPDKPGNGDDGDSCSSGSQSTPWGIARVNGGSGNASGRAFVLDTGIDLDHCDLNVSTADGFNAFTRGRDGRSLDDGHGHGSHVAGTIGAMDNDFGVIGVAPGAIVVPVKVLGSNGSGSNSGVIAGVDHVALVAGSGDVANMSLGGGISTALDNAVIAAANSAVFALAAGNSSQDASFSSPARAGGESSDDDIYTISAIDSNDDFASFSNFGDDVEFAEPGVSIPSTYKNGGYATMSGTSMAAPHAAGILLLGSITDGGSVNGPGGSYTIGVH